MLNVVPVWCLLRCGCSCSSCCLRSTRCFFSSGLPVPPSPRFPVGEGLLNGPFVRRLPYQRHRRSRGPIIPVVGETDSYENIFLSKPPVCDQRTPLAGISSGCKVVRYGQ